MKAVDNMSTTTGAITLHEAQELRRHGMVILNCLGKHRQHTRIALSGASRGRPPKGMFQVLQPQKGRNNMGIRRPQVSKKSSIVTNYTRWGSHIYCLETFMCEHERQVIRNDFTVRMNMSLMGERVESVDEHGFQNDTGLH
jgi:hypothetical protein